MTLLTAAIQALAEAATVVTALAVAFAVVPAVQWVRKLGGGRS